MCAISSWFNCGACATLSPHSRRVIPKCGGQPPHGRLAGMNSAQVRTDVPADAVNSVAGRAPLLTEKQGLSFFRNADYVERVPRCWRAILHDQNRQQAAGCHDCAGGPKDELPYLLMRDICESRAGYTPHLAD